MQTRTAESISYNAKSDVSELLFSAFLEDTFTCINVQTQPLEVYPTIPTMLFLNSYLLRILAHVKVYKLKQLEVYPTIPTVLFLNSYCFFSAPVMLVHFILVNSYF